MSKNKLAGVVLALALLVGGATAAPAYAATQAEQLATLIAQVRALQAQLAALTGETGSFSMNLTLGSSGPDVTRLQSWLIGKGYGIPAGATGYFGAQTQSALARYQAAVGIVPASGYFGPITRARVNSMTVVTPIPTTPTPSDTSDRTEAADAIDDLDAAIDDAQDDIDDAEDDGEDVDDANDLLDDARDLLADAEDAFDDEDYDEVMDLVDEAMDVIDEANVDSDNEGDAEVSLRTATTQSVSGADNDYATFKIRLTLNAFGDDMYLPQDADDAVTYQIEDASDGSVVGSATTMSATFSSSADEVGDYYIIDENGDEEFTLTVTFDPTPGDEGKSYRLQLLTIEYNDSENAPDSTWSTHGDSEFQTPSTYISD